MNTCSAARCSVNGLTSALVRKQNTSPKKIEMGSAGSALRLMANSSSVRQRPWAEQDGTGENNYNVG